MIRFEIPDKPPTVNQMYFNVHKKGRVKTTQYQKWINNATVDIMLLKPRPSKIVTDKYGLIIELKKHHSADYSNYIKPIEDLLVSLNLTPDDKHNILPLCIGKEGKGVRLTILDEQEAQKIINMLKKTID